MNAPIIEKPPHSPAEILPNVYEVLASGQMTLADVEWEQQRFHERRRWKARRDDVERTLQASWSWIPGSAARPRDDLEVRN